MARKFLTNIDLGKNELQNARVQNLASAPSSPVTGQVYYDTVANKLYWWNGSSWIDATGVVLTYGSPTAQTTFGASSSAGVATSLARSDHTHGTPAHDAAAHSAIKISDLAAPSAAVAFGSQRITSVADPTSAQDAATKAYVDTYVQGLDFKTSVRVASSTNGTLASAYANGQTVDGVTLATGDRILLAGQTTASENGIYVVAASGAPTRATDADASGELSKGTIVYVESGTANGAQLWVCTATSAAPWVPGSSTSTWTLYFAATATQAGNGLTASGNVLAVGAGTGITVGADTVAIDTAVVARKYAANVGDGSATAYTINHALNTRDVTVQVYLNSGTYEEVLVDVEHTDANNVTLRFTTAPGVSAYRVIVIG